MSVPIELGGAFSGGPDLTVRCLSDLRPTLSIQSSGGTVRVTIATPEREETLLVRSTIGDVLPLLLRPSGHASAQELQSTSGDDGWRSIPPFDFVCGEFPATPIPGADAVVLHETIGSPVGDFTYHDVFVDGCLVDRCGGVPDAEPLVVTRMSFAARVSPYEVPLLERLEGSTLRGRDDAALMFVAGLYDRHEIKIITHGQRETTNRSLARLAAHVSSHRFRQMIADVIEATS